MTDLRALAFELLREAQQSLEQDGNLTPTVVVITPEENLIFEMEYENDEERDELYSQMVETALEQHAQAILTVDDVYLDSAGRTVKLEGPGWGSLSNQPAEAVLIVISGSGFDTSSVLCPYLRNDGHLIFQPAQENRDPGAEVELLGDWTGRTGEA